MLIMKLLSDITKESDHRGNAPLNGLLETNEASLKSTDYQMNSLLQDMPKEMKNVSSLFTLRR